MKTPQQAEQKIESILEGFLESCYKDKKLPFMQYKIIRETFLAGMIAGFRNTVEICSQEISEKESEDQLGLNAQVIERMALDAAFARFKSRPIRVDDNFEADKEKFLKSFAQAIHKKV